MSETHDADRVTPTSLMDLLRSLDWRLELIGIALVLAEASLVYLVSGILLSDSSPESRVLSAWIVGFVMLTAHIIPRTLDEWRVWGGQYEAIMGAGIVVTLLVALKAGAFPNIALWDFSWLRQTVRAFALLGTDSVRPVWGLVALVAYAWWRGRTRDLPAVDSAYLMLRVGSAILALLIVIVLAATSPTDQVHQRLSVATIAFYVCALGAIGFARLKLEGFRTSSPLGPRWLATFAAPILTVLALAIIGAGIFSRQFLDTVLWMLSPLLFLLNFIFEAVILIMAVLAYIILTPLVWLIGTREPISRTVSTPAPMEDNSQFDQLTQRAVDVPDAIRYLVAALILLAIFAVLTKFVFRRRRRERQPTDEERESIMDWDDMLGSLANRFRSLFQREQPVVVDPLAELRDDPRWQYTVAIRETYQRLQRRGADLGRGRRPAETADEYRPGVTGRLSVPNGDSAVRSITDRYRDARYSGEPATAADAEDAARAWQEIERGGRSSD